MARWWSSPAHRAVSVAAPRSNSQTRERKSYSLQDERIVGGDGVLKVAMANLMPGTTEKMEARMMHKTQFEDAPPGPDSPGAVERPEAKGTAVDMNRRKQRKSTKAKE